MIIRFLIILFSITLADSQLISAQSKLNRIKEIQEVFKTTNSYKNLRTVKLSNEEFLENMTDGGGELTGFFKNDTLIKMSEWIGVSYGVIAIDYYFEDNELVFSYVQEKYFPATDSTIDRTKLILKFEGRYYYERDELFAQKNSGSGLWGDSLDKSNPILNDSKRYSKLLVAKVK